ncbi:ABC transporter permease [Catenulispora subtropica]|uniref:ABC3 transporter permease C-terminal domain-containing protein n=1 Tax=Catenulispora subtropica TaxID=450798 RepID=A0ABN2R2C9_9ACTN
MYPNLTPTLLALLGAAFAAAAFIAIRKPFLRRLALRQVSRRRTEAMLVVGGSVLGSAVIAAGLIVGDTLNYSVGQNAYQHLGPVDEIVDSSTLAAGAHAADLLAPLKHDPRVDGLMTVHMEQTAVASGISRAVPRAYTIEADFTQAAAFGAAGGPSGLSGTTPVPGQTVVNSDLATALHLKTGDPVTLYVFGQPVVEKVARIVPTRGLAGLGESNSDGTAFVAPGTFAAAAQAVPGAQPRTLTLVSNAGGVTSGDKLTASVTAEIRNLLGSSTGTQAAVQTPKHDVLKAARDAGNGMGSLFLFIGSFCIIVGVVLLMNIFVMLAEERKPEMGMLRAIGLKRSRLVRSFLIEGSVYALAASVLGVLLGIGVGRLAVVVAARIFRNGAGGGNSNSLSLVFHFTATSLVNALAMGFLIAFLTALVMSVRISRFNIIAAIRDLPAPGIAAMRTRTVVLCLAGSLLAAALSVPAVVGGRSVALYIWPTVAIMLAIPVLTRFAPPRAVYTATSFAVLAWTSLANTVRPHVFDTNSTATYIIMGCILIIASVILVSQNQETLLRPFRRGIERPTAGGLTARLAVTYPLARRFRTGALLMMYSLIVFTLVLLSVLNSMIQGTVSQGVSFATGGYALRLDYNPATPPDVVSSLGTSPFAGRVAAVAPLTVAPAKVQDLGPHGLGPANVTVVGLPGAVTRGDGFALMNHMAALGPDDRSAWRAVASDPRYVILDQYVAVQPGPAQTLYTSGDHVTLVDQATGRTEVKTIAGVMKTSAAFLGIGGRVAYPILMSDTAAKSEFGAQAVSSAALVTPAAGVSETSLAAELQGHYLTGGMVVTPIAQQVRQNYNATLGFFQLMQGFLILGLLIAVAGLGVVMVRAVRERRRTIGVLRALGYQARWIRGAFLGESALIATEGIVLGTTLSVFVSYLLFRNNAAFSGYEVGFSVPWIATFVITGIAFLASMAATYLPARKAAQTLPAVALRIVD